MTRTRSKLPIDPLPDAAWNRISDRVFSELESGENDQEPAQSADHGPRRHFVIAVAALLAAVAVATVLVITLRQTEPAQTGSRVVTTGSVTSATVGDATLQLGPDTEFVTTGSDAGGWMVVVERGRVEFAVPERANRPSFRVRAGSVLVEVVGTRFVVLRAGDAVGVTVERGSVRVTSRGEARVIHAGETWDHTTDIVGKLAPSAVPAPASLDTAPPRSPATDPVRTARGASNEGTASSTGARDAPSRRERFEEASRLEASDPGRAVDLYLELGKSADAWAANALYAAGRVELERGRSSHAKKLFREYLQRFPEGQNAYDARKLLERTE